jgi:hypothetical protein
MKKPKLQHPSEKVLILLLVIIIGLLVSVLWYYGDKINILWAQNGNNASQQNNATINTDLRFYIQSSLKSLYQNQAVIDPVQKRVYVPEANLYMPLNSATRKIVYFYSDKTQDSPAQLEFATSSLINTLPVTFNDVPCLQRHITVSVDSTQTIDGNFIASKKLEDGRTLNIYRHQEGDCTDERWSIVYSSQDIIGALQQAHSY